jgi:Uma2 family endonuclease
MAGQPQPRLSVEEYLEMERTSEVRHEYFDGEIFAMVGVTESHVLIVTNLVASLGKQLRGGPFRVYANLMRVQVAETGLYTYPDLVVLCEEPRFLEEERRSTLLNPTLIAEVLSESTEAYERGKKFEHYRTLDSLTEYLLVAQDEPRIEHFTRREDGWFLTAARGLDGVLALPTIGCELRLAEVYERVEVG